MRDRNRVNAEIKLACAFYGENGVFWARDGSWISISEFPLPPNLNMKITEILILIPDQYGYGAPMRDCFVNPELKVRNSATRQFEEIPHYFQEYPYSTIPVASKKEFSEKKWRYLCLHEETWHPQKSNIMTFLKYVSLFLNDPFKDWNGAFNSYKRRA